VYACVYAGVCVCERERASERQRQQEREHAREREQLRAGRSIICVYIKNKCSPMY